MILPAAAGAILTTARVAAQPPASPPRFVDAVAAPTATNPSDHRGVVVGSLHSMTDDPVVPTADQPIPAAVSEPFGDAAASIPITLDAAIDQALANSPHIAAIMATPAASYREIAIADAAFDTTAFLDTNLADTSDPIGSVLTTGTLGGQFRDSTIGGGGGVRQRNRYGGQVELAQRGVWQRNNSTFLLPNPQSTTRLNLNFTQPLMRDAGRSVNRFRIVLASLNNAGDVHSARQQIESHLYSVASAYWDLYRGRAWWIQYRQLLDQTEQLVLSLRARRGFDVTPRQLLKAESTLLQRRAEVVQSTAEIRDAQSRLASLIASDAFELHNAPEFRPVDQPVVADKTIGRRDASIAAITHRADIAASIVEIRKASRRMGVARNGLRPRLDLILSGYVSGLNSRQRSFESFRSQFVDGRPSVAGGVLFEMPYRNRAARARVAREQFGLNRRIHQFDAAVLTALTEVDVAVRRVETTAARVHARIDAVDAAQREQSFLRNRLRHLPDPNESTTLLIDDLLEAQSAAATQRRLLVSAQTQHALSHLQLRRAMGLLVHLEQSCGQCLAVAPESTVIHDTATAASDPPLMDAATGPLRWDSGLIDDSTLGDFLTIEMP